MLFSMGHPVYFMSDVIKMGIPCSLSKSKSFGIIHLILKILSALLFSKKHRVYFEFLNFIFI